MIFSEYLLDKNLVTADQILVALMEQLRSIPSTPELIYDKNIIPRSSLLKILVHQQNSNLDFVGSAKVLGFWDENIAGQVKTELQKLRRPLSEILVQSGAMSLQSLASALDDYVDLSNRITPKILDPRPIENKPNDLVIDDKNAINSPPLDPSLSGDYVESFTGKIAPAVSTLIMQISSNAGDPKSLESTVKRGLAEFAAVRAAAKFLGAKQSEAIAEAVIDTVSKMSLTNSSLILSDGIDIARSGLNILMAFSEHIKDYSCEPHSLAHSSLSELLDKFWTSINRIRTTEQDQVA